jgi:hypothetical protein
MAIRMKENLRMKGIPPKSAIPLSVLLAGLLLALFLPARIAAVGNSAEDSPLAAVGTAFTYQGRLVDNGVPAEGPYDFEFRLFDASAAGVQVGSTLTIQDIPVTDGYFNAELDFGSGAFGGGARWLEVSVRPGVSAGAFTILSPRQKLSPAPYAMAMPNVYTDEGTNFVGVGRNFRVSGNEVFGVRYTGSANQYGGMYVETSNAGGWPFYGYATNGSFRAWTYYNGSTGEWSLYNAGIRLAVPSSGGLRIGPALNYSLVISNTTGSDGIRVLDTGDDAIQIGSNPDIPNYGVYIPSPGVSTYGLWSNTSNASGEWALYTVDNVQAGNVLASAYSLVTRVTGSAPLAPGDLAAVSSVTEPIPGGTVPMPLVRLAEAPTYTGIIGVVHSRMVYEVAPGKGDEGTMSMHSTEGPAMPGDYVSLVVFGVAQVNIDPDARIAPGERLTASNIPGMARALNSQEINGMQVVEGAPVIGIALAAPAPGQKSIPVFVSLR